MTYREVARKLRRLGCQELPRRGGGSHRKWYNPATGQGTTIPDWGPKDRVLPVAQLDIPPAIRYTRPPSHPSNGWRVETIAWMVPRMKRPDEVKLSRAEGEALRKRLAEHAVTADDYQVLGHVLEWYFWLIFTLREATLSLKRLRILVFGESSNRRKGPPPGGTGTDPRGPEGGMGNTSLQAGEAQDTGAHRPGHGRLGAQAYGGAQRVECRHEALAVGQRCPVCGLGRLYTVPPGVEMRIDGHALLSALRYELEKLDRKSVV